MVSATSGFMKLPLELRQMVYRQLLRVDFLAEREEVQDEQCCWVEPAPMHLHGPTAPGACNANVTLVFETSILRVSRQIHEEAVQVLYGENGFFFTEKPADPYWGLFDVYDHQDIVLPCSLWYMERFLNEIGSRNVTRLRVISIELWTDRFLNPPNILTESSLVGDHSRSLANALRMLKTAKVTRLLRIILQTRLDINISINALENVVEDADFNPFLRRALFSLRTKRLSIIERTITGTEGQADYEEEWSPLTASKQWVHTALQTIQERPPRGRKRKWITDEPTTQ